MGNLIYSDDFIYVDDPEITARSTAAGYLKADLFDYWHLKARHRAGDVTKSDINPLFIFDLGSAQTVAAVYLNDINYNKVSILGHASDLGTDWAQETVSFDSGDITVSQNPWTGRYQAYIPLTAFNYRYLAVCTVAAATAVGSYTTYWETGAIVIMDSAVTLTNNVGFPVRQSTEEMFVDIGRSSRIALNDITGWVGEVTFGGMLRTSETEAKTLGRVSKSQPVLVYLNASNTSEAYVCLMDSGYSSEWFTADLAQSSSSIRFREIIGM